MTGVYEVIGYWPGKLGPDNKWERHGQHLGYLVVCETATEAAQAVETRHPGCTIRNINHKGQREVIILARP